MISRPIPPPLPPWQDPEPPVAPVSSSVLPFPQSPAPSFSPEEVEQETPHTAGEEHQGPIPPSDAPPLDQSEDPSDPWSHPQLPPLFPDETFAYHLDDFRILRPIRSTPALAPKIPSPTPLPLGIPRLRILTYADLETLPDPTWLIDSILPANSFSVLYGESGLGKSFLALDWAASIATGISWQNHPVAKSRTAYLIAEGAGGFKKRCRAWLSHQALPASSLNILFIPEALNLRDPASAHLLITYLKHHAPLPSLLVVDTLARNLIGGDENSAQDMGKFVACCEIIQRALSCTVLAVHHPDKRNQGERGSGALRGACDTMFEATITESPAFSLTCVKQKDAEAFSPIALRRTTIDLGGKDLDSQVITADNPFTSTPPAARAYTILKSIQPATAKAWKQACAMATPEIPEGTFWKARKELVEVRKIVLGDDTGYRAK